MPLAHITQGMADNKRGREKQADDAERRQQERELDEARTRADEPEPEVEPVHDPGEQLGDLDGTLENHDYPTTTDDLIEAYGDQTVETQSGWESIDEVLAPIDNETYDSADDVRIRIQELIHRE